MSPDSRTDPAPLLDVDAVVKSYGPGSARVLDGVSLRLAPGEYIAIRGESGVGKSTLLNLLAGLDHPDAGHVRIDGIDLASLSDDAATLLRRRKVGFVFQAFHVLPYLTVVQNVELPLSLLGLDAAARRPRALAMLEAVGLGRHPARYPRELSGGELQRVAIARALVHRPGLVLADEPTGNLDPSTAAVVLALLREQLRANGGGGILITHSPAVAATADRVLHLTARGLHPE